MTAQPIPSLATRLVGANPTGAVRFLSLATRPFVEQARENGLPPLIAVSGGADSTALAAVVIDHATRAGLTPHALTVDHGIREGSDREAANVAALMEKLGAQTHVERAHVYGNNGPEANARNARRTALATYVRTHLGGRAAIFLGHTMNDQAETVLLRLARGSGVGSLRAMSPEVEDNGIRWVRPLLTCTREQTEDTCRQLALPWVNDPTNAADGPWKAADGSPLRRAALRDTLLPELTRALGSNPIPALARTASQAARDDDALNTWAQRVWDEAECSEGETVRLRVRRLVNEPDAILARIAHRLASAAGYAPTSVHVERVCDLVQRWEGQGPVDAPGTLIWREKIGGEPHLCARSRD